MKKKGEEVIEPQEWPRQKEEEKKEGRREGKRGPISGAAAAIAGAAGAVKAAATKSKDLPVLEMAPKKEEGMMPSVAADIKAPAGKVMPLLKPIQVCCI